MTTAEVNETRGRAALVGLFILNLLAIGIGLVRVGRLREGLFFAFGPAAAITAVAFASAIGPLMTPKIYLVIIVLVIAGAAALLCSVSIRLWRASRFPQMPLRWWQRWYSLGALYLVSSFASFAAVGYAHSIYEPYYSPSASMEPTLPIDDQLLAYHGDRSPPTRGEVVLVALGSETWVKRVVAVGGDRIAIRRGVPVINAVPAMQRRVSAYHNRDVSAVRFVERFPDERDEHDVLDGGESPFDEMSEMRVPPGHVFVLGDNRDNSLDSRMPRATDGEVEGSVAGLGMVPVRDLRGRAIFRTWSHDYRWLGTAVR